MEAVSDAVFVRANFDWGASSLRAFHPSTGEVLPGRVPEFDGPVYRMRRVGDRVYATGAFANVGQQPRSQFVALDANTSDVLDYFPSVGPLQSFWLEADEDRVYLSRPNAAGGTEVVAFDALSAERSWATAVAATPSVGHAHAGRLWLGDISGSPEPGARSGHCGGLARCGNRSVVARQSAPA